MQFFISFNGRNLLYRNYFENPQCIGLLFGVLLCEENSILLVISNKSYIS